MLPSANLQLVCALIVLTVLAEIAVAAILSSNA